MHRWLQRRSHGEREIIFSKLVLATSVILAQHYPCCPHNLTHMVYHQSMCGSCAARVWECERSAAVDALVNHQPSDNPIDDDDGGGVFTSARAFRSGRTPLCERRGSPSIVARPPLLHSFQVAHSAQPTPTHPTCSLSRHIRCRRTTTHSSWAIWHLL